MTRPTYTAQQVADALVVVRRGMNADDTASVEIVEVMGRVVYRSTPRSWSDAEQVAALERASVIRILERQP
jgi:hypothetical protein